MKCACGHRLTAEKEAARAYADAVLSPSLIADSAHSSPSWTNTP